MPYEVIAMNVPISEMDKQLRATPTVSLVWGIEMNKGKRNTCLFLGVSVLTLVLFFSWNRWLLLFPAGLGIGAFLYQMNITTIKSEVKRRSEET